MQIKQLKFPFSTKISKIYSFNNHSTTFSNLTKIKQRNKKNDVPFYKSKSTFWSVRKLPSWILWSDILRLFGKGYQGWKNLKFWCLIFHVPRKHFWCTCAPRKNVHLKRLYLENHAPYCAPWINLIYSPNASNYWFLRK